METIVVIGANHAGTAALNTILDNYKGKEVIAFDANSNISFLGCGMALWIGNQIDGPEGLFYSTKEALEQKGAKIYMETPVDSVDFENQIVYATGKDKTAYEQHYDKLILATGSLPVAPPIEGVTLKNVQYVKLYQNAEDVIEKLKDPSIQNVTIVGAGYIGVELAEAFQRNGRNVTLIDCAEYVLGNYYDIEFCRRMEEQLTQNGIRLMLGTCVKALEGDEKVERVVTFNDSFPADMVVLAVGFRPNTILGKDHIQLFQNGAYQVNRRQQTSLSNVYAIGDCATVYDNSIHDISYIALATNAVRSGIIAANNACGHLLESPGVQGSNAIRIFGLNMVSTGLTLNRALKFGYDAAVSDFEDLQKPAFIKEDNYQVNIRIVYDKKSRLVLGAQMCSDYDISMGIHMFSLAIQEQVTIDKLKLLDVFFLPHFNQPYNYITMAALQAR